MKEALDEAKKLKLNFQQYFRNRDKNIYSKSYPNDKIFNAYSVFTKKELSKLIPIIKRHRLFSEDQKSNDSTFGSLF